jgi:hypothetical protein
VGKDASGLRDETVVQRIDVADAVHPCEREHDLAPPSDGHRTPGKAGVSSLGHDRYALARAKLHRGRHLVRIRRTQHAFGGAAILLAPVDEMARHVVVASENVGVADDRRECLQKFGVHDP